MATIEEVPINDCCGCSSCAQKCPKGAIKMEENKEGFLYPVIDKEKCINCGLCSRVCPQLKKIVEKAKGYPKAYAMRNKNIDELSKSASGGIFSVLANYVIDNDGVVFGAVYDSSFNINHVKANTKEELFPMRGSKYVQSNINNSYKAAEESLKNGKYVLFTGTPCQIAGLNSYLGKEYEKLITAEIICHGVPSQKLFHKYLDYLSEKFKSKVVEYNFRSKDKIGLNKVSKVRTKDGKIRYITPDFDPYYSSFLNCLTFRKSCYQCHYTNYNRISDFTMGDFWGIKKIHPDFYKETGNSLVLVNNEKAEKLLEVLKDHIDLVEAKLDKATSYNKNLIEPSKKPQKRDTIYNKIDEKGPKEFMKSNLKCKVTFKSIAKEFVKIYLKCKDAFKKIIKAIFPLKIRKG